jgi:hypothetical protein
MRSSIIDGGAFMPDGTTALCTITSVRVSETCGGAGLSYFTYAETGGGA